MLCGNAISIVAKIAILTSVDGITVLGAGVFDLIDLLENVDTFYRPYYGSVTVVPGIIPSCGLLIPLSVYSELVASVERLTAYLGYTARYNYRGKV